MPAESDSRQRTACQAAAPNVGDAVDSIFYIRSCDKDYDRAAAEKAKDDYEVLAKEVVRQSPRKDWIKMSGEGLVEAAQTCAKLVVPITTCVKGIPALFGVPL